MFPRRLASAPLLYLGLVLLGACQSTEVRQERLVDFIDELMFGSPFDAHAVQDKAVLRWETPLCVAMLGSSDEDWVGRVARLVERMAGAAGRDAELFEIGDCTANVVLHLTGDDKFLVDREYANCYMTFEADGHRMTRASVFIGRNRPNLFDRCLAHEFMHVFGFRYHSGIVRSVLSPAHGPEAPTDWDILALRVLYDPRLRPALNRRDALPVIRAILAEREGAG